MVDTLETRCCIAGGGPAGVMLGYLLARAGVPVVVLEKHRDFLRDFRGDTVHPSTLEILAELGLLDEFLQLPHQEVRSIRGIVGGVEVDIADFTHLPTKARFVALVPQWDFLEFLVAHGRRYPTFQVRRESEVTDLVEQGGRVAGVRVETPQGHQTVLADLVVGADGRHSTVRARAGLRARDLGAPIDVLWMQVSRREGDPAQAFGRFEAGRALILIDRGAYWQCGFLISKGANAEVRAAGLDAFQGEVLALAPFLGDRVRELDSWERIKLLTVAVDRLVEWHRPGVICIGDSAHAMSPVGGVGINLAIQDAVAAANVLVAPLLRGTVSDRDLARIQARRELPTRVTQRLQVFIHDRVLRHVVSGQARPRIPWSLRALLAVPGAQRIPARIMGVGVRPEHVKTPDAFGARFLASEPTAARAA